MREGETRGIGRPRPSGCGRAARWAGGPGRWWAAASLAGPSAWPVRIFFEIRQRKKTKIR